LKFRVATSVKVDSHAHDVEVEVTSCVHCFDLIGWLFIKSDDEFMFKVRRKVRRSQLPRYLPQLAARVKR
jgi:hypothetical protein